LPCCHPIKFNDLESVLLCLLFNKQGAR
jgi:hypothetical protein